MDPSQTYSLEELDVMVAAGMDKPIENLIVNHPYLVFVVERRGREVFGLLGKNFLDDYTDPITAKIARTLRPIVIYK